MRQNYLCVSVTVCPQGFVTLLPVSPAGSQERVFYDNKFLSSLGLRIPVSGRGQL